MLSANVFYTLKKVIESMLEATEHGLITFDPCSSTCPLILRSVDALYVTQSTIQFSKKCLEQPMKCSQQTQVHVHIDIKALQTFVWKCKGSKRIQFTVDDNMDMKICEDNRFKPIHNRPDDTPYEEWNVEKPLVAFSMSSIEFGSVLLDLAVGGTEAEINMDASGGVELTCRYDSNINTHYLPAGIISSNAKMACKSGPYIVKFLKLFYNMSILATTCDVHLFEDKIIIQHTDVERFIQYQFCVRRYVGPRRIPISNAYRSFAILSC